MRISRHGHGATRGDAAGLVWGLGMEVTLSRRSRYIRADPHFFRPKAVKTVCLLGVIGTDCYSAADLLALQLITSPRLGSQLRCRVSVCPQRSLHNPPLMAGRNASGSILIQLPHRFLVGLHTMRIKACPSALAEGSRLSKHIPHNESVSFLSFPFMRITQRIFEHT
jgi:hypothetical protein